LSANLRYNCLQICAIIESRNRFSKF